VIPKRAIFFWEGEAMPWLQRRGVESFRRLNPDWDVEVVDGSWLGPLNGHRKLGIVHRSDCTRYHELAERGGLYFDTDIIFIRPIPESYLAHDYVVPLDSLGKLIHIALLGSRPGLPFFQLISEIARRQFDRREVISYQGLGVSLLKKYQSMLSKQDVLWAPLDLLIPVEWNETHRLWNGDQVQLSENAIGVHWFGGDPLAQDIVPGLDEKWAEESECLVARAVRGQLK